VVTQQPVASPPAPDVRPIATPTVSTAANASAEIASVIEAYARAIESRDITELRRVYAAISTDQVRAFSDFFASTRTLRATLSVRSVQVDGAGATARVAGIYEFTTTAGRTQEQPVSFQAELHRDGTTWKLVTVR
jgi:ketosteroid isomerase-like protein